MTRPYRVGAIGMTGRGDFGHGLDSAFQGVEGVETVAVSDPDPTGRGAACKRSGAERAYADYREMLAKEDLDIVSVSPRWCDQRVEMISACAEVGVKGIFCEKPMARTPAEADVIMETCRRHSVRLAVAHRRVNAYELRAKEMVDEGVVGNIRVMRGHGKADHRAGAQDLAVLGTHILDSMRFFAQSNVMWVHGHVTQDSREVTPEDIREGDEGIGLIAGNSLSAYFAFENGITAHYESYQGDRAGARWFGFEIYGTRGVISLRNSPGGEMYLYPHGLWIPGDQDGEWERIWLDEWEKAPDGHIRSSNERTRLSNQMIVKELIQAIVEDRDVIAASSGQDARAVLEMIAAVHESQRLRTRVALPLINRGNPYQAWLDEARSKTAF